MKESKKKLKNRRNSLTLSVAEGIMLNGIVCPTRAPETQVIVKHSKLNWRKKSCVQHIWPKLAK